jgi:hypothetical protein
MFFWCICTFGLLMMLLLMIVMLAARTKKHMITLEEGSNESECYDDDARRCDF